MVELSTRNPSLNAMFKVLANLNETDNVSLYQLKDMSDYSHSALEQAASNLIRLNLIKATRGPGGGYRLNQPLSEIKMGTFMRCVRKQQPVLYRALELISDVTLEDFIKPFVK